MDHELTAQFVTLLERHLSGDADAIRCLHTLPVARGSGECLWRTHREWLSAFSYEPGRTEVLPLLIPLAQWLKEKKRDSTLKFFAHREWRQIGELRGPVDTVGFTECSSCGFSYPVMNMIGHCDTFGLPCDQCGDVFFCDLRDDPVIPACHCGGQFFKTWPCPKCGCTEYTTVGYISPYEYFASHNFMLGPSA